MYSIPHGSFHRERRVERLHQRCTPLCKRPLDAPCRYARFSCLRYLTMNRAERRRRQKQGLPFVKEPVLNIKASDIQQIKKDATNTAADTAFFLMLTIPVMVIHDKYPQIMRRVVDGKSREERFADLCLDLYDSFNKGYVTLDDLAQCLWEEAGIKLEKK